MLLALMCSILFEAVAGVFDNVMTQRGLKAGVAVEGNTWLVGQHPSATALYLRDGLLLAAVSAPAIMAALFHNTPLAVGFCAGPVVLGAQHIKGALAWKKLLTK